MQRILNHGLKLAVGTIATVVLLAAPVAQARYDGHESFELPESKDHLGIFALRGEFVHNVGELQINITNWGLLGSRPSTNAAYSDAPSAMWPAGSGVDYLWGAGLWVGAVKNGVPLTSTGQFTPELLANGDDPLDTIYEMSQGEKNGARYPDPSFNDDNDLDDNGNPLINEDPKNEVDDDGDGLIDEDFSAIGNQHFRCVLKDNTALSQELFPNHDPLDIEVVQETFQWENESVDDFVGFEFRISNIGVTPLKDVYVGFFADCDIGPRSGSGIAEDDLPGFWAGGVRAKDGSIVPISVAYMYDADTDNGQSPGFFGMLFLNHDTDPSGETAPVGVRIRSFQAFSGNSPFDRGGDPTTDAERYELLSRNERDQTPDLFEENRAADFRILMANGPFPSVEPGQSIQFQAAMVVGSGLGGLRTHAAEAALTFYGAYFNRDNDSDTGIKGRETQICQADFGPPGPSNPIFSLFQDCVDSTDFEGANPPTPIADADLDEDGCLWVNQDCLFEEGRGVTDCTLDEPGVDPAVIAGCTGVQGNEFFVPWLVGLAPDAPNMRLWKTDGRVHIYWNNRSEVIKDVRLQEVDFESYFLWRADGWERPFGSSITNGPESQLWSAIAEFDRVSYYDFERAEGSGADPERVPLGANTGLDPVRYIPQILDTESAVYTDLAGVRDLIDTIMADPEVGPFVYTDDPNRKMRVRDPKGEITAVGAKYGSQLEGVSDYFDQVDTVFSWNVGVRFYEYIDRDVHNGIWYFYSVTASDFAARPGATGGIDPIGPGLRGDPQSNFEFAVPVAAAQSADDRSQFGHDIYVVPNPATKESLAEFSQVNQNSDDPTGVRIMFNNLPKARNTIRIYTLAGDLVETIDHDGTMGEGSAFWNFVSRNGQEVVSGIYLYSVESDDSAFERVIGRFVFVK